MREGAKTLSYHWLSAQLVLVLAALLATSCNSEPNMATEADPTEPSEPSATDPAESEQPTIDEPPEQPWLSRVSSELTPILNETVFDAVWRPAITHALSDANPHGLPLYRRNILGPLYQELNYRPVFVQQSGRLHERAEPLLRELRSAYQHALDTGPYRLRRLDELEQRVLSQSEPVELVWPSEGVDWDAIAALAAEIEESGEEAVLSTVARRLAGLDGTSPQSAFEAAFRSNVERLEGEVDDELAFELSAAHSFLSYAFDMRHFNTIRMSPEELREQGGQLEVQRERLRESFRAASAASVADFEAQLEALIPHVPQYPLLMSSLAQYREIIELGGWQRVRPRSLRIGSSNARVRELKERLAIEGFYTGPIDNEYDQALADAVTSYQESHQMQVTGETHNMFWSSLNIPAERRLHQVELTLQRWRETRLRDESYYVFVNIPDFHAEVWRDGEMTYRFRVVVGNNERQCNPLTGTMDLINATPTTNAEIEYIVFNPYWNVPVRIRRDELDLELAENPAWLQENGYEVVVDPSGPRVRQLPGPDNALGDVKFIFPNIYNIYMHDTPHQQYFRFPIRAYSHGCVRVQNPMTYAEVLLTNDGNWNPDRIAAIQEAAIERSITLSESVPIFIEYYVVQVDPQGRTNFLADVYRYDRIRLGDYEPEPCEVPVVAPEEQLELVVWNEDGSAMIPDGTVVRVDGTIELSELRQLKLESGEETTEITDIPRPFVPSTTNPDEVLRPDPGDLGP